MPEGGRLVLETSDVEVDDQAAARLGVAAGPYVRVSVRDSGRGIPPEILPHVFEPFYSTRAGGTGLGLATCWGIAKQSFGHISIESAPGSGTLVELLLPAHAAATVRAEATPPAEASGGHGECILVVEDEDLVRTVVARTLEAGGYRVRAVDGPHAALDVFDQGTTFDLLISDVVMPGMDGPQLARRLLERNPALPVLLISGYSDAILRGEEARGPTMRFLPKPFSSETLLAVVGEMLEARTSAHAAQGA
jgi:two-component system cell cycle sensor histidine kinase/response regulator CckA